MYVEAVFIDEKQAIFEFDPRRLDASLLKLRKIPRPKIIKIKPNKRLTKIKENNMGLCVR